MPLHLRADGKLVAYLPPPQARLPEPDARAPIRLAIFPRYVAGAALVCTALGKAEALGRIFDQCTVIDRRLDAEAVRRLTRWIGGVECREIVYGRTEDAVAAIAAISPPR